MRLSESLQKNIIETSVGNLLSKFKIKRRRDVLFFEDILASYIKECEKAGYEKEIKDIAQKWMNLAIQQFMPKVLRRSPPSIFFSIFKKIWINLGLMDDINATKNKNIIKIETINETPTRIIGKNDFIIGFYTGFLNILFNSQIECLEKLQTKKYCKYVFNIENKPFTVLKSKEEKFYNKLNQTSNIGGFTFKDALKNGIFQLKENNKLYFRGSPIILGENTLSHLIGNSRLLLKRISYISYNFFKKIIKKDSTDEEKLLLIKMLLQITGWGIIKIIKSKENIYIEIKNLPYGLQTEEDNWEFLVRTVLGYLWLLNKDFRVKNISTCHKKLIITYSKRH